VYWCALGRPARTFRWGLGIATLQPVSSTAAGFTTNPLLDLWESAVAQVLNHDRQRAPAATQRRCCVQAADIRALLLSTRGGTGGWGGGEGGAASWEGGAVDGGSVHAFLAAALTRVMRVAVPIPAVASASVFHSAAGGGSVVDVLRPF